MLKRASGRLVRRLAPRSMASLEEVVRLREQVGELQHRARQTQEESAQLGDRARTAEDDLRVTAAEVGRLRGRIDELEAGLAESRRLSLRVAQLSDLVFDRLADLPEPAMSVGAKADPLG